MTRMVVVFGNPIDGLRFTGPFSTRDSAVTWAGNNVPATCDWWLADLESHEEEATNLRVNQQDNPCVAPKGYNPWEAPTKADWYNTAE